MGRIVLPSSFKEKTHKPLFCNKCDVRTIDKIDQIAEELEVAKWMVIDSILSSSLGFKSKNSLDLSKWLKVK